MLLIDGNPILYRAAFKYALTTSAGVPSGIVYGTIKMLETLAKLLPRQPAVVFWDHGRSRYRTARYPAYKDSSARRATRDKIDRDAFNAQRTATQQLLAALGVRQMWIVGVEADDLIAMTCRVHPGSTIVADDMDLWQLVGVNGTQVYTPRREAWISSADDCVRETGLRPDQIPDYKALCGDTSDNIPGVEGCGEKTSKAILAVCGSVQELYRRLRAGEPCPVSDKMAARLLAEEERAKLWFDLCQPLDWSMLTADEQAEFSTKLTEPLVPDEPAAQAVLDRYELRSLVGNLWGLVDVLAGRLPGELPAEPDPPAATQAAGPPPEPSPEPPAVVRRGMKEGPSGGRFGRLMAIRQEVLACRACTMRADCAGPVPGNLEDDSQPPWAMIVGRNPGASEDRVGRGFVGPAGRRLDLLLAGQDASSRQVHGPLIDRKTTWVSNVAKCFSIGNRPPTEPEWHTCAGRFLREEIRTIQPRLILTFGAEAMAAVSGYTDSVMQRSGTTLAGRDATGTVQYAVEDGERRWAPVIPEAATIIILPHPAAALRAQAGEMKLVQSGRIVAQWLQENRP